MKLKYTNDPFNYKRMTTEELRNNFLIEKLFSKGEIELFYTDADRAIVGSAVPLKENLILKSSKKEMASEYFAERREIGIMNIGSKGIVKLDGKEFELENKDCLYVGKGTKEISFSSIDSNSPAEFYIISYPAHKEFPSKLIKKDEADLLLLGSFENANKRKLRKYIHPAKVESCQLVMGFTEIEEGSVWNTFPPHTHQRRSEIYTYFDMEDDALVFHFMGTQSETRNLILRNKQSVISPSFSIHCGAGTKKYSFIWAMGGENQDFDDMDMISPSELK